jgi:hypothetical protein
MIKERPKNIPQQKINVVLRVLSLKVSTNVSLSAIPLNNKTEIIMKIMKKIPQRCKTSFRFFIYN